MFAAFWTALPARSSLASEVKQLFAACFLHPANNPRLPPFARPSASSISATGHKQLSLIATGPCSIRTLGLVSRQNSLATALLRQDCGSQPNVSSIHPLAKASILKLRLERFRTSHARVGVNVLLLEIGASEINAVFVSFLFKSCTCCGVGWKRSWSSAECTRWSAKFFRRHPNTRPALQPMRTLYGARFGSVRRREPFPRCCASPRFEIGESALFRYARLEVSRLGAKSNQSHSSRLDPNSCAVFVTKRFCSREAVDSER